MRPFSSFNALPATLTLSLLLSPVSADDLQIEITKAVECTRKTRNGDDIYVHYRGILQSDGTKFDSSYDRGPPFEFVLGAGQVIAGWDKGLLDMCIGEGRTLTIPPEMAYGNRAIGKIPAGSTLIFETELTGIDGVKAEEPASSTFAAVSPTSTADVTATAQPDKEGGPEGGPKDHDGPENDGECKLLGPFALLIQGALGALALSSLVYKRWRETPRRPLKIWWFDVSKQVFGSVLLHLANLFMSLLSSGEFDVAAKTKQTAQFVQDDGGRQPNPCSFYLLNLAIDTTIGIPILVLLLKLLHKGALLTPLANPPESVRSGNYGHPPRAVWWLKQSIIYFLGLFGMKLCVFFIFQLLPWIAWVGDWALSWTEGNEAIQITFVMLIFPLIMNALQYWIIDGFIKDPGSGDHQPLPTDDESDDESGDEAWLGQRRRCRLGESDEEDSEDEAEVNAKKKERIAERGPLKEANPTPIPSRRSEYDPAADGAGSGGSEHFGNEDDDKEALNSRRM